MRRLALILGLFYISNNLSAQNFSQWRGPDRTGVYNETGILKNWPESGPEMLWFNDKIPAGFSSPAIANNKIYLTGIIDSLDVLLALDMKGKELWRKPYGKAWNSSFPESRCTPTLENDKVFVSSGKGDVACINANNGEIIWSLDAMDQYGTGITRWGLAESLLIDQNKVYFSPGGNKTAMIALDKGTGKLVWKTESLNDNPSYTSPLMIEKKGKNQIINVSENFIFGVNPNNGGIEWIFDFGKYQKERNNNTNTPLYSDGELYVTSGYDHAGVKLKMSDNLDSVSLCWTDSLLDNHHGGLVKVGDYIFGSNWIDNSNGNWACISWKTGEKQYEAKWKNKGSIISTDGMLIISEEKSGNIALLKADPKEFKIISSFKVPKGSGPLWAHPVINNGILYVRHGTALMAFKIK